MADKRHKTKMTPSPGDQSSGWASSLDRLLKGAREVEAPQTAPTSAPAPFGFLDVGPASTEFESTQKPPYTDYVTLDDFISGNIGRTSQAAKEHIADVIRKDLAGDFARATSIYDQRRADESIEDFVRRAYPDYQAYRGKKRDGDVVEHLRRTFLARGFLDGLNFTRATLTALDAAASTALRNWLYENESSLPGDIPLPSKRGHSDELVKDLSPEQVAAVLASAQKKRRKLQL